MTSSDRFVVVSKSERPEFDEDDFGACVVDTRTGAVVGADGGEPEDQVLWRDWAWVPIALNAVEAERAAAERDTRALESSGHATEVRECIDAAREVFARAAENDGALGPDDVRTLRVAFGSLVSELDAAHNLFAAFGKDESDGAHVVPQRSAAWELGFVLAMQRALGELGPSLAKGLLSVPEARASLRDACAEAGELAETMVLEHALSLAKKGT